MISNLPMSYHPFSLYVILGDRLYFSYALPIPKIEYLLNNRIMMLQMFLAGVVQASRKRGAFIRREKKFELRDNDKKFAKQQA